jgi:ABC-2 type transport system permease protein
MNTVFTDADGAPGTPAAPAAGKPVTETLITLVRREFWEHRALWLGPVVAAALVALAAITAHLNFDFDRHNEKLRMLLTPEGRAGVSAVVQWVVTVPLYIVTAFVLSFYLLDCLFAERRDRSILFWKSLPVSDGLTVTSKLVTALIAVPFGVFLLAIVTQLAFSGIVALRVALGTAPDILTWNPVAWLQIEFVMLLELVLAVLWYAPVAAILLLLSAWVRRPLLWATLPPIFLPILERIAFGTHYLWSFLRYRTIGIWHVLTQTVNIRPEMMGDRPLASTLLAQLNFAGAFTSLDLWLGVLVAAALVYATIRLRRYRDET